MSQRIISQISQLFAARRFAEAEKLCLSAAETNPGDSTVPAIRGAIKLELGDVKSAINFLSKAISLDSRNAMAHFNLGVAYQKLTQPDRAIASLRTALGIAGPKPMILTAIGLTELARGRTAEAAVVLEQAASRDANSPVAFLNWGEALKASGQHDKAIAAFTHALLLAPNHVEALNSLGAVYADLKRPEAEQYFRRALEIEPRHVMARNNLGVHLKSQERLDEALVEFEAANVVDPKYAMAYFNAGNVLKDLNRPEAALEVLERAVKLRPDLAEAHFLIGWIHFDEESLHDAKAALNCAVQTRPDYVDAHVALGALYRKLRNWKEARKAYDRALAVDFRHFEALLGLGQTFSSQGLFAAADECFRRSLELQPEAPAARIALARALFDQSKLDAAEQCCREIIAALPKSVEAHLTLGDILVKQRRTAESLDCYGQAIAHSPLSMRGYVRLAEALQKLGRKDDLGALIDKLAALATSATSAFLKVKILTTIADIASDPAPFEEAMDLAIAIGRIADFSLYPLIKPTMRLEPTRVGSLLHKLNAIENAAPQFAQSAFYRARSVLLHENRDYDAAWRDLMLANRLILEASEIDLKEVRDYQPDLVNLRSSSGQFDKSADASGLRPIFVLGASRSGKSTLERLLALSPEWTALDEYTVVEETFRDLNITRAMFEGGLDSDQRRDFSERFRRRCERFAATGVISFTAPGQLRYAKLMAETVPGVRFVFVRRNDLDVVFRCLQKLYKRGNYYSYDVQECMTYTKLYNEMMDELSARLGERARNVAYEDLVRDASAVITSLWQWVGSESPSHEAFEIASDIGCSVPYRRMIAAELGK